jgi:glycosyltransferase involved in cell wall biosynthesis
MSAEVIPGLVSTILPVYNRPDLLRRAVQSVLDQTYRPIEILLVDDGSTDETSRGVDEWAGAHPGIIRALHIPNGGVGVAREAGRQLARGEFIQYLDSDDELLPRKFERQIAALVSDPTAGIAYSPTGFGLEGEPAGTLAPWKRTGEIIPTLFPSMLADRWWGTCTPLYRRALTDAAGPWLDLRIHEDWEYDCRLAADGVRLAFVPELLSRAYRHSGPHLSGGDAGRDPGKLSDRARAVGWIGRHARRAGLSRDLPEMRHFARAAFLLSRLCGVAGEEDSAHACWKVAMEASSGRRVDLRAYGLLARALGWGKVARLVTRAIAFSGRAPGPDTLSATPAAASVPRTESEGA